jgi:Mn-dependent DtxR family transcriptional regulator
MDITSEYIGYMFNSLVNRGYLKGHRSTGFQLTTTGREAVHNFIKKNNSKATDIVERLRLLGIEINTEQERKLCKLEQETVSID